MKTFTIGNLKGGVAKTTTTVNLAYSFRQNGLKVLVVDLDPQCNTTKFFTKIYGSKTVERLFDNSDQITDVICHSKYDRIDIIKGSPKLSENIDITVLRDALAHVKDQYDICVIDTRPTFENLTQNAVYASDVLLTPIIFDNFSRDNLALVEDFYHEMKEYNDSLEWKVVAVMVANAKAQRKASVDLITKHDYPILETCISRTADINNALTFYKPVMLHRRKSQAALDYLELANEILA